MVLAAAPWTFAKSRKANDRRTSKAASPVGRTERLDLTRLKPRG